MLSLRERLQERAAQQGPIRVGLIGTGQMLSLIHISEPTRH